MKQMILITLLISVLSGVTLNAQLKVTAGDIVSKENVSIKLLKTIFENSYYEILETTSTYIKIKDDYNIYIDLDKDNRYLTYSVKWSINSNFSQTDKLQLLNKISKEVLLVTPYYSDSESNLVIKATIWIEGGSTVKNIILSEKIFVKALKLILEKDTDRIIKTAVSSIS
jgi:hypothetical protein